MYKMAITVEKAKCMAVKDKEILRSKIVIDIHVTGQVETFNCQ